MTVSTPPSRGRAYVEIKGDKSLADSFSVHQLKNMPTTVGITRR